jgi:hypothetical protein
MQEARRRLSLGGKGTIHVAGMAPLSLESSHQRLSFYDPFNLIEIDQRPDFWRRWATANSLSVEPPEAMGAHELLDLTNEPLLAYLLILSGYVSDRWQEAAENRNRIYQAIFNQIWDRERRKPTRINLNDLGQEGFEALLQALGIAAWRGGGRTGDEATFISVRDIFVRPHLLKTAKACGAADLGNVALLFYTRKDEEGGRGYEFLHKSFGEYLTARGLFSAFKRWGAQADDPDLDFDLAEFLRRWLRLTGPTPITREIVSFLRNEVRLHGTSANSEKPWEAARTLVGIAARLVDAAVADGLPAHEFGTSWRAAEIEERNGEETLLAILDSVSRASYPEHLLFSPPSDGGWTPGPVTIETFKNERDAFAKFYRRISNSSSGWYADLNFFAPFVSVVTPLLLSRLDLSDTSLFGLMIADADFSGTNFEKARLAGFNVGHSILRGANFRNANLEFARFAHVDLDGADFTDARFNETKLNGKKFGERELTSKLLGKPGRRPPRKRRSSR